jgi:ribonuclease D
MSKLTISDIQVIDTSAALKRIKERLETEKIIAVDLEADSMYHFSERVCLIQIASERNLVLIDPLKIEDLSPIRSLFSRKDIKKIFHGADYDVRSLFRDFNIEINNLFDTEIACRYLGIKGTGLDAVLFSFFDLRLNKKYQKTDWSRRPLPQDMLEYAAGDVLYLIPLAKILEKSLKKSGRLPWVEEECLRLSGVRPSASDHEPLYLRFKGAGKLSPRDLAVLEALLRFRMLIAEKKDKPLFRVLRNKSLLGIATHRPQSLKKLQQTGVLSEKEFHMYGSGLVDAVNQGVNIPKNELPRYPHKKSSVLKPIVTKRIKALKDWREGVAKSLELDPSLIFPKAILTAIAAMNPRQIDDFHAIEELRKWQIDEFGEAILPVLKKT